MEVYGAKNLIYLKSEGLKAEMHLSNFCDKANYVLWEEKIYSIQKYSNNITI